MVIGEYKNHLILLARQTGGKAGKGKAKTSTLQVYEAGGNIILKAFRFRLDKPDDNRRAARKAKEFIDGLSADPGKSSRA